MSENHLVNLWKAQARVITPGNEYTLYIVYCTGCRIYKRIYSSAPAGPGGTLSCPVCRELKQHGPGLEGAYGHVHAKPFKIILPTEVEV